MSKRQIKPQKIKILVLSHISELLGGAERSMLDVFDYWAKQYDIEPEFIIREPIKSLAPALTQRGWKYYPLRYTFWSDGRPPTHPQDILINAGHNARAVEAIEGIIAETKPDIVMTNSIVSPWAALAAYYQRVPHIWFVREYGDLDHGRVFEIGRDKTWQDVGNLSDLVVTISKSLADHVTQYVDKQKVTILYNPFNIEAIRQRAAEKVNSPFKKQSSLKVIMLGNLAASKGQLEAIKAVAKLNQRGFETELCVIGQMPEKDYMQSINEAIAKHKLQDKVHLLGYKTSPLAYVRLSDVGVMASRREGFGRSTFEYLAAGKAVVGANSGATPEMVLDGQTGYLFEPGDPDSLADALEHYAKDKELAERHGQNAAKHARAMMSGDQNADALFKKVAAVAAKPHTDTTVPINFTHRLLEYVELAQDAAGKSEAYSIRRQVKMRLKQKARPAYYKLRSLKTKMFGK
jgi:glycosyltransferase involved in cell wall biosynthesis